LDVDCKRATFTRWQEEFVDAHRLIAAQRRRAARVGLFQASRKCVLLLDARLGVHLVALLCQLAERMSRAKRNTANHAPFTILLAGSDADVRLIKTALLDDEIWFNDGYEEIAFNPVAFDDPPVVNTRPGSALIDRASYKLRVIRLATYVDNCPALQDHYGALAFAVDIPECVKARSAVVSMAVATDSIEEIVSFLEEFL
jgi:hypothetical protein